MLCKSILKKYRLYSRTNERYERKINGKKSHTDTMQWSQESKIDGKSLQQSEKKAHPNQGENYPDSSSAATGTSGETEKPARHWIAHTIEITFQEQKLK